MDREQRDEGQRLIEEAEREIEAIKQTMQQISAPAADPAQAPLRDPAPERKSLSRRLRKLG